MMHLRIGSVLLLGAMVAASAMGQDRHTFLRPGVDVAVTYSAARSNQSNGSNGFWMQGGASQLDVRFGKGFSAVADVAGSHAGDINSSGVGLDMITATFGPRYTLRPGSSKLLIYGQGLFGVAHGFNSVFPALSGSTTSENSFAILAGGGSDVEFSPRLKWRIVDVDWLRTQLPNGTTDVQNNLRLGTGVVFRIR